jgi:hypothetical protein
MPNAKKFPASPEIKRVLSAARAAGLSIGLVEIETSRIRIHARDLSDEEPKLTAYDLWKLSEGETSG